VPNATSLDLPSINYQVLILPKYPHYVHIIAHVFPNIFLSTNTTFHNTITFIFINNSATINTFQFHQHPFIITILNPTISQLNHIYFYQQFHNYIYIPISSTSIYHHNSQSKYITTQPHIFINNFHNQISSTSSYQHNFSNQYLTTHSHIFYQ